MKVGNKDAAEDSGGIIRVMRRKRMKRREWRSERMMMIRKSSGVR